MDEDDAPLAVARSGGALFSAFGMQWDEYEVPFDPAAALDGDG